MNRKVTVVGGAGNVGATVARGIADKQLADVVVVSYKSRELLRGCVEPLAGSPHFRVIVVDNDSPDRSLDAVADLDVATIARDWNAGFARASPFMTGKTRGSKLLGRPCFARRARAPRWCGVIRCCGRYS